MPQKSLILSKAGAYQGHRARQRRRILAAAQELFDQKGVDRVSMANIVTGSGLRASTLYEYFSNKDDVVWALVEQSLIQSSDSIRPAFEAATGSGLEKITALFQAFENELLFHPARVRLLAQFDAMYALDWSAKRLIDLEDKLFPNRLHWLGALIHEGIADGSLRPDLNPDLTMHSVINAVTATQRRLASLGSRVEEEYGQPVGAMFRETMRIILLGLRAAQ